MKRHMRTARDWLLHSQRRFLIVLAVVGFVVLLAVNITIGSLSGSQPDPAPDAPTVGQASTGGAQSPRPTRTRANLPRPTQALQGPEQTARGVILVWLSGAGKTAKDTDAWRAWRDQLGAYASDAFPHKFEASRMEDVPIAELVDVTADVMFQNRAVATATLSDGSLVLVDMSRHDDGWAVEAIRHRALS